jgi:hypothetical protein
LALPVRRIGVVPGARGLGTSIRSPVLATAKGSGGGEPPGWHEAARQAGQVGVWRGVACGTAPNLEESAGKRSSSSRSIPRSAASQIPQVYFEWHFAIRRPVGCGRATTESQSSHDNPVSAERRGEWRSLVGGWWEMRPSRRRGLRKPGRAMRPARRSR